MKWESDIILTERDRCYFIGKVGTGKSTRRKAALARAMESGQRVLSFDVLDEDSQHGRARKAVTLGPLTERMTMDEFAELDLRDLLSEPGLALALVPVSNDPEEWAADFKALVEDLRALKDTPGFILSASELGGWAEYCAKAINQVALYARHWGEGVAFVADAQRATGIPYTARTQASQINSGLQDMPDDVDALRERCGDRFGDEVASLNPKKYEFRHWRDTDGRWERAANNKPGRARARES